MKDLLDIDPNRSAVFKIVLSCLLSSIEYSYFLFNFRTLNLIYILSD